MFYAIQENDVYILKFKYDPQLIAMVKNVPGRKWVPENKYWTIPKGHLGWLLNEIKGTAYEGALQIQSEEAINENASIDSTDINLIPDADISDVDHYVKEGYKLYDHQLAFLKYAKSKGRNGFILADDMGCIAGDATITVYVQGHRFIMTMERLFSLFHSNPQYIFNTSSYDEVNGVTKPNLIRDVKCSGYKLVYELELENGYKVKATEDHQFFTRNGYVELADLVTDSEVFTVDECKIHTWSHVVRKTLWKCVLTYDIVMADPYRNFFVNGILVHNCGKTLEVLNYAMYQRKIYDYKHCLIITCVNSAKYSWQEDIAKHTNGQEVGYILGTRKKRNGSLRFNTTGSDKVEDLVSGRMYGKEDAPELPYFLITNIEALGRTKVGRIFTLEEAIIKMINEGKLQMIAIDECHKNMSPQSTQGKVILDIKKRTEKAVQWIPMTGTPIKNKPTDVFTPLKLVDGHAFKSYYLWSREFCIFGGYGNHEIMGYKNIPILKDMLQGNMIRRMKSEVLDLPPKIYYTEYVENTPRQQVLYEAIVEELYQQREEILSTLNPLTAMLRLRQVNGSPELVDDTIVVDDKYIACNAKLKRLMELVDDAIERNEKVIIFSNWIDPLRTIYKFLSKKYKTCCYTGSMNEADREKHKRVFQNNPEYKVMLGTIGAMGVSLTLTAATNVIFYDDCWTPADKTQAEDRSNRIGSTEPLKVYTLLSKDTVDERVYQILEDKRAISNYIVDGKLDLKKNPELFDFLLGRSK